MLKNKILILLILIITFACKDEFLLESKGYKPVMVVNGLISNEPPPYTVDLSFSSPVNTLEKYPFQGCIVTLFEKDGNKELLRETEPGVYCTDINGIQGIIGNEYYITILTPDNIEYESEHQVMREPVEIDSLYAKLFIKEDIEYIYGLPGYQFYTNSKIASNNENYFLWEMIETYQYTANYLIYDLIDVYGRLGSLYYYKDLYRCWKSQQVNYIFTGKTSNLSIPKITNQPLHFVATDSKRLQERYSLLLKQYSINENSYYFWKGIEDQNSQENFLESNQPYNIIGNIKNINNPAEEVFGNFTVGSVTEKRIFVNRPRVSFYYEDGCSLNFSYGRPTIAFLVEIPDRGIAKVSEWCINCEMDGGKAVKPDFWVDF